MDGAQTQKKAPALYLVFPKKKSLERVGRWVGSWKMWAWGGIKKEHKNLLPRCPVVGKAGPASDDCRFMKKRGEGQARFQEAVQEKWTVWRSWSFVCLLLREKNGRILKPIPTRKTFSHHKEDRNPPPFLSVPPLYFSLSWGKEHSAMIWSEPHGDSRSDVIFLLSASHQKKSEDGGKIPHESLFRVRGEYK